MKEGKAIPQDSPVGDMMRDGFYQCVRCKGVKSVWDANINKHRCGNKDCGCTIMKFIKGVGN